MYLSHWGIERPPFQTGIDIKRFYRSPVHDEALARIEFLASSGRRLGVLLGPGGVGKSFVLRVAARLLSRQGYAVVLADALGMTTRDLFWQLASDLGTRPAATDDTGRLWRRVADRIAENRIQGTPTVLLLDDAGEAGPDLTMQLVRLARIDPRPDARWTIILTGEPHQAARFNSSLTELIDLRIDLPPWDEGDTVGFVQCSLVDAGRLDPVFEEKALHVLHELSRGVPRQVARIADFALLAAAGNQRATIDAATVRAAHEEIRWNGMAAVR